MPTRANPHDARKYKYSQVAHVRMHTAACNTHVARAAAWLRSLTPSGYHLTLRRAGTAHGCAVAARHDGAWRMLPLAIVGTHSCRSAAAKRLYSLGASLSTCTLPGAAPLHPPAY
jgi:hypothetical protein